MEKAYILGGARSYIGVENGLYRHVPAERLGAAVLKRVLEKYAIVKPDLVICGNAVGVGGNLARLMLLEAGVPEEVPAFTVDMQCGSGLESIATAAAKIQSGQAEIVVAGGFESSSTAPRRGYHKNHPDYRRYGGADGWYQVAKFAPGDHLATAMLEGAERTARSEGIDREMLNHWVLESHHRAVQAREQGVLSDLVLNIGAECMAGNGESVSRQIAGSGGDGARGVRDIFCGEGNGPEERWNRDEGIRDRISERLLNRLPCILKDGQVITAGNACLTHDGAAFVVLCSGRYLQTYHRKPQAEFVDVAELGADPGMSPKTAILAIEKLLARNDLREQDIDCFECNEAFAVIDELFARWFPTAVERYNIWGGALAYGHPYGASGGIITLHALRALEQRQGKLAVCSVAAAGGVGTAVLLRRLPQGEW